MRGFIVNVAQVGGAVHLYCRGEDGEPFLVRDTRYRPAFYLAAEHAPLVRRPTVATELRALHGGPVVRVEVEHPQALRVLRDDLAARGIATFEADLRHSMRYCIERGLRGALDARGLMKPGRVFDDPELVAAAIKPELRVLSIDIETTLTADRVLSIALHGAGSDEVLLLGEGEPPPLTRMFLTERDLLLAFSAAVLARDPDVITGWNVIDFDLSVLNRRARANAMSLRLGRDGSSVYVSPQRSFWNASSASLTGRVVLDGIQLLRGAFVPMEEMGLDFVGNAVLGAGKTLKGPDRFDDLQRLYHADRAAFVAYNLNDAQLVSRILEKLGLIALAMQRSLLTGMPLDRVAGSIASFDALYLPELHRRGFVAPSVSASSSSEEQALGGLVLEPAPGLYEDVLVVDFKSLYPSIIRTFQIDPLGHVRRGSEEEDLIVAPNGARFRREPAVLPGILDQLFPQREEAKRRQDAIASHAIKILMNSLYGVLGSSSCRFHDSEIANAITGFGREILLWTKARIEASGHRVLYGDTDSLFVLKGDADGASLVARINQELDAYVRAKWRVESKLELELDTLYARLFLPKMRQSEGGARKRYVGLVAGEGVVFTGMEVVRRDWTELAKRVQRELFERLFSDRPVDSYLREILSELRRGALDGLLVYKKALRKPLSSYTASTPPHVAAARKLRGAPGRLIAYVMTVAGPEPFSQTTSPIDRAHYIEKQIRPVAEPVLELLGLDFDAVAETQAQLRLF